MIDRRRMKPGGRALTSVVAFTLILMAEIWCASDDESTTAAADSDAATADDPSGVLDVVSLEEPELDESSGLAVSRRRPNYLWTHNDSGGRPRLYAFDRQGRKSGHLDLVTDAVDWEDMASYVQQGQPRLLIADCGDNQSKRTSITLHLIDEPDPTMVMSCPPAQTLSVVYPDGRHDCESIAVDARRGMIVLISKTVIPAAGVYVINLPSRQDLGRTRVTARRVATLPLPMITGIDIDQTNGDLWVTSYFQAFRFRCLEREMPLERQVAQLPRSHELPRWKQIEAIAVDARHDIWLTSEGGPALLGRLAIDGASP